jgi:AmiR/NasT family two-component response regulator
MGALRVLICEDEGLTALRMRVTLSRLGYEVVGTARNGLEIVAAVTALQPDAIFMDVEMPNLDGISATRRIMQECPTPVIIVTAYSDRESLGAALEAGAAGYLVKPVTDEQLAPALQAAVAAFQQWPATHSGECDPE